uniref:Uncharacterized protein n=1 Tax=Brugia malayi TaxID=6279 RepID=A8QH66_BRUMA
MFRIGGQSVARLVSRTVQSGLRHYAKDVKFGCGRTCFNVVWWEKCRKLSSHGKSKITKRWCYCGESNRFQR